MKKVKILFMFTIMLFVIPMIVKAESVINVITQGSESNYKIDNNYGWTFNFKNVTIDPSTAIVPIKSSTEAASHNFPTEGVEQGYYDKSYNYVISSNSDCSGNKIYMLYKNVGMYQGKKVNLKVSVKSCEIFNDYSYERIIGFSKEAMQLVMRGVYSVNLDYEFLDDTGNALDIKGYGTLTDLDAAQAFKMGNGIDKAYMYSIPSPANQGPHLLKDKLCAQGNFSNLSDVTNAIQSRPEEVTEETSNKHKEAWATILFSGGKFNLSFYLGTTNGMFVFTPDSLVPFAVEKPVKGVDKYSINKTEEFTYTTSHRVPYINLDGSGNKYTAYAFNDTLEPCLTVKDVSKVVIKNDEGTDVTSNFDIKLSESNGSVVVDANAKDSFLTSDNFYGHEYEFMITTQVKDNYDLSKYLSSDKTQYIIPNIAHISVTDNNGTVNNDTNKVDVVIPIPKEVVPAPNTGKVISIPLIIGGCVIIGLAILILIKYKKNVFDKKKN